LHLRSMCVCRLSRQRHPCFRHMSVRDPAIPVLLVCWRRRKVPSRHSTNSHSAVTGQLLPHFLHGADLCRSVWHPSGVKWTLRWSPILTLELSCRNFFGPLAGFSSLVCFLPRMHLYTRSRILPTSPRTKRFGIRFTSIITYSTFKSG